MMKNHLLSVQIPWIMFTRILMIRNPNRKRKILTIFNDLNAKNMANKIFKAINKEIFIRRKKLNVLLVFVMQSYFSVPKDVRLLNVKTYYLIMKIHNKI